MSDDRTALERHQLTNETFSYPRGDYQDTNIYGYGADEGNSQIDLSRCLRGILKRKWSIALLVLIVTSLVTFEMYRRKETYQSYAIVSVGKEDTSLIKYGENDLVIQSDESMKTKLFMLNSTPLLNMESMPLEPAAIPRHIEAVAEKHNWSSQTLQGAQVYCILNSLDSGTRRPVTDRRIQERFYSTLFRSLGAELKLYDTHLNGVGDSLCKGDGNHESL